MGLRESSSLLHSHWPVHATTTPYPPGIRGYATLHTSPYGLSSLTAVTRLLHHTTSEYLNLLHPLGRGSSRRIKFDRKILKYRRDIENKYELSYSVGAPEIRTEKILKVPAEIRTLDSLLEIYLKADPTEVDKNALIKEVLTNRPQQKILLVVNPAEAVNINTTYYSRELIKLFFGEKFWEENIKEPNDLTPLIGAIGHDHIIYGYVPVTINLEEAQKKAQAEGKSLEEVIKEVIDAIRMVIPENVTIVVPVEKPVTATPLVGLPEEKNNQETLPETDKGTENSDQSTAIYLLPIIALIAFILLIKKR